MFLVNRTCPVLTFRATDAHNERERASASVGGAQWCARVVTNACASSFCVCHVFGLRDRRVFLVHPHRASAHAWLDSFCSCHVLFVMCRVFWLLHTHRDRVSARQSVDSLAFVHAIVVQLGSVATCFFLFTVICFQSPSSSESSLATEVEVST